MDQAIIRYSTVAGKEFSLEDAVDFVTGHVGRSPELEQLVIASLELNPYVFTDYERNLYVPRAVFFKGRKFLITLTEMERKLGILIPGHRFLPFAPSYLPPNTYLLAGPRNRELKLKRVRFRLRDLHIFYTLLDYTRTMEFLASEDERNTKVLLSPDVDDAKHVHIWVFDIASILQKMPNEASFEVTVEDYDEGMFRLKPVVIDGKGVEKWCNHLEETLAFQIVGLLGPDTDVGEQLAWAFFMGPSSLTRNPKIHIGGFLGYMREMELMRVNGAPILWIKGLNPEEILGNEFPLEPSFAGVMDSIDGVLTDIGSNLRETEIESYMRDTLYQGRKSLAEVQNRMSVNRIPLEFINEAQEQAFNRMVEELWSTVRESYNRFTDQRPGKCRHDCLAILDVVVAWMSRLSEREIRMDMLPKKEFMAITSLASMIFHTLIALNQVPNEVSAEELSSLIQTLPTLKGQAEQLMQTIDQQLFPPAQPPKTRPRPVFRVIQGGKDAES